MLKNNPFLSKVLKFSKNNKPQLKLDQNFLIDNQVIDDLIIIANLKKSDRVLEVGTGLGFLTIPIAKKVNQLITVEIDQRFKPFLLSLPKNVHLIFGDAYQLFCNKKFVNNLGVINKIIGNFPYSKIENLLHPLMKGKWFDGDVFMIGPASFVNIINQNPIFSAYYKAFFIKKISKSSFFPSPKTTSAIIHLKRIKNPEKTKNSKNFIRRFLYEHESWKLKNALREGVINLGKTIKNKKITKNQARIIIKDLNLPNEVLEKTVYQINPNLYFLISEKLVDKI